MVEATRKPFMCEFFHADMIDMVWTMLGAMTGTLRYQEDIVIQHNHSTKQKQNQWDETFQRLRPVQIAANGKENQKLAASYATLCAKNLIDAGIGKWNILL
jgi:predicted transcriptional regulator